MSLPVVTPSRWQVCCYDVNLLQFSPKHSKTQSKTTSNTQNRSEEYKYDFVSLTEQENEIHNHYYNRRIQLPKTSQQLEIAEI